MICSRGCFVPFLSAQQRRLWRHYGAASFSVGGSCVRSAAVGGDIHADMLESLGFITIPLPDNKRELSALRPESGGRERARAGWGREGMKRVRRRRGCGARARTRAQQDDRNGARYKVNENTTSLCYWASRLRSLYCVWQSSYGKKNPQLSLRNSVDSLATHLMTHGFTNTLRHDGVFV